MMWNKMSCTWQIEMDMDVGQEGVRSQESLGSDGDMEEFVVVGGTCGSGGIL